MNFNNMLEQKNVRQVQQQPLNNTNLFNSSSSSSSYDYLGLFILIAMLIKACAQIPLIIKITQTKSAEDISIIMPIMFLASFSILGAISLSRKLYFPLMIFGIGIAASIILIVQISIYEKSKSSVDSSSNNQLNNQQNNFQFPDPKEVYNRQS
jgi:uncharacterized protein with PQ loop repeat